MTSNIGKSKTNIGFNSDNNALNTELKEFFNIAFLNRIDDIIKFNNLEETDIEKIIKNKIKQLKNKFKDIDLTISKNVIDEIINESNYHEFGARKIDKIIKNHIENIIIDNIINNNNVVIIDSIFSK